MVISVQNKPNDVSNLKRMIGPILFIVVAITGLFIVKWNPYFHKTFLAIGNHSIGASIVSGKTNVAPPPSWSAAWNYSLAYFKAIWQALIVGVVLGSLVQIVVPKDWILRFLGKTSFSSTAIAGVSALPGMMCTCCAAPLVVGLRKQQSSIGAAIAFWMGNTALNPAVLVFMTFVLSWKFTVLRIVFGAILVFGVSYLANRFEVKSSSVHTDKLNQKLQQEMSAPTQVEGTWLTRWMRTLWKLTIQILPAYVLSVLLLGMIRTWLFPALSPEAAHSLLAIIGFAIAGTLFVIPTAGEIPIIQTLQQFGLGMGPAAALLITLPVISIPSVLMVRQVFSWKIIGFLLVSVCILGILAGLIGQLFF